MSPVPTGVQGDRAAPHAPPPRVCPPPQRYQAEINDLENLGEIGSGTCGQVWKMRFRQTGHVIAVKVGPPLWTPPEGARTHPPLLNPPNFVCVCVSPPQQMRRSGNREENKRILMDLDVVLKSHDCPYIVQCFGTFITNVSGDTGTRWGQGGGVGDTVRGDTGPGRGAQKPRLPLRHAVLYPPHKRGHGDMEGDTGTWWDTVGSSHPHPSPALIIPAMAGGVLTSPCPVSPTP